MAERKYLNIFLWLVFILFVQEIYASAHIPDIGVYKYSINSGIIDNKSKKLRKKRIEFFEKLQNKIFHLGMIKDNIYQNALNEKRELYNSELRTIKSINEDISNLETESGVLNAFSDDIMSSLELEYGVSKKESIGLKLGYYSNKFVDIKNEKTYRSTNHSKNLDMFLKYKLLHNKKYIVTLRPQLNYSNYNNKYDSYSLDLGILIGRSKKKKKYTNFQEMSFSLIKSWGNWAPKKLSYKMSLMEGFKFKNNVMISNYTEYQKSRSKNYIYSDTIYDQISIAKDFYYGNLKQKNYTVQIGYFWKGTKVPQYSKFYIISGPLLSAWFNL